MTDYYRQGVAELKCDAHQQSIANNLIIAIEELIAGTADQSDSFHPNPQEHLDTLESVKDDYTHADYEAMKYFFEQARDLITDPEENFNLPSFRKIDDGIQLVSTEDNSIEVLSLTMLTILKFVPELEQTTWATEGALTSNGSDPGGFGGYTIAVSRLGDRILLDSTHSVKLELNAVLSLPLWKYKMWCGLRRLQEKLILRKASGRVGS